MVRQFKGQCYYVFAVCRDTSVALNELMVNVVAGVDVTTQDGQRILGQTLRGITIDILYQCRYSPR